MTSIELWMIAELQKWFLLGNQIRYNNLQGIRGDICFVFTHERFPGKILANLMSDERISHVDTCSVIQLEWDELDGLFANTGLVPKF